jgi:hypothetical protein
VAEGKILEDHVVVATAGQGDHSQEQQCQFKHVLIPSGVAVESNTGSAISTFWRTTVVIKSSDQKMSGVTRSRMHPLTWIVEGSQRRA